MAKWTWPLAKRAREERMRKRVARELEAEGLGIVSTDDSIGYGAVYDHEGERAEVEHVLHELDAGRL